MSASIEQDSKGIWVLRIGDALRKEEMDAVQEQTLKGMHPQEGARVLVLLEPGFRGWAGGEAWNDMTFFVKYGDQIGRIAIVGDPKWESRVLMFSGAGFRKAPVKYFAQNRLEEAYGWLG
jgi:hypothetical protein